MGKCPPGALGMAEMEGRGQQADGDQAKGQTEGGKAEPAFNRQKTTHTQQGKPEHQSIARAGCCGKQDY